MTAREMQRRSTKARWSGKSKDERASEMSVLAQRRSNGQAQRRERAATDARTLGHEIITRATALSFLVNNLKEVKNQIGGVIGYRLELNAEQTEDLWRILDMSRRPNADSQQRLVRRALSNIISSTLKRQSAPCSSMAHEDSAIVDLCAACPEWKPWDDDAKRVVEDAKEHMAHYRPPNAPDQRPEPDKKLCN